MKQIIYNDINDDKDNIIDIINKMIPIYKQKQHHTQVLECEKWILILSKPYIQKEYVSDEILSLKNILNDCANIYLCYGDFDTGSRSMNLLDKIVKMFK